MNTQTMNETLDFEDATKAFDQDLIRETLPQIQTLDDVKKTLVHEQTDISFEVIEAQINHQIDPSYQ